MEKSRTEDRLPNSHCAGDTLPFSGPYRSCKHTHTSGHHILRITPPETSKGLENMYIPAARDPLHQYEAFCVAMGRLGLEYMQVKLSAAHLYISASFLSLFH